MGSTVPKRSANFDWTKPVDGSDPETEWQGYLGFDELPQLREPEVRLLAELQSITPLHTTPVARSCWEENG